MKPSIKATIAGAAAALLISITGATAAYAAGTSVIYDTTTTPLPGNMVSQGFEATATSELKEQITFARGTNRTLTNVVVTMSSWGCNSGHWYSGDCVTRGGSKFSEDITLNLYNPTDHSLIASVTQTFAIPYRPSASSKCTGDDAGKWYDASTKTCFNGFATNIKFNLHGVTVPDSVEYGIAYNTTHYGSSPKGQAQPCFTSAGGCGYDSLNVALSDVAPKVGTDVVPTGYTPAVQFKAAGGHSG